MSDHRSAPCRECAQRSAECHAACEKYAAWREKQDSYLERAIREGDVSGYVNKAVSRNWQRNLKRNHGKVNK